MISEDQAGMKRHSFAFSCFFFCFFLYVLLSRVSPSEAEACFDSSRALLSDENSRIREFVVTVPQAQDSFLQDRSPRFG